MKIVEEEHEEVMIYQQVIINLNKIILQPHLILIQFSNIFMKDLLWILNKNEPKNEKLYKGLIYRLILGLEKLERDFKKITKR